MEQQQQLKERTISLSLNQSLHDLNTCDINTNSFKLIGGYLSILYTEQYRCSGYGAGIAYKAVECV